MLYPFCFDPILKERVWGGRNLELLYRKPLPPATPIGESWEISDRPGDESVIRNGPLAGKTLRWLMTHHSQELLGKAAAEAERFPLLIKILDAQDVLSLQVHPPLEKARELGGEPKTEMWYIAKAQPEALIYAGLRRGVTRQLFEAAIRSGTVQSCFHSLPVAAGDAMFLPSGRVHAIGAGLVIFEIQQNSDTTYRVFDWNRLGLDGKPRELHVPESLASIDFNDVEPALLPRQFEILGETQVRPLVSHSLFHTQVISLPARGRFCLAGGYMQIVGALEGALRLDDPPLKLEPGDFCLVPACMAKTELSAATPTTFLLVHREKQ